MVDRKLDVLAYRRSMLVADEDELLQLMPQQVQDCWRVLGHMQAKDPDEAALTLRGFVGGYQCNVGQVEDALKEVGARKPIHIHINTYGGDAFEGVAIQNLLRMHKGKVTLTVLGVAASAGFTIALGADEVRMFDSAQLMMHRAWSIRAMNCVECRKLADDLEMIDTATAKTAARRSKLTVAEMTKLIDAETWMSGTDAVKQGLADTLLDDDDDAEETGNRAAVRVRPGGEKLPLTNAIKAVYDVFQQRDATHAPLANKEV